MPTVRETPPPEAHEGAEDALERARMADLRAEPARVSFRAKAKLEAVLARAPRADAGGAPGLFGAFAAARLEHARARARARAKATNSPYTYGALTVAVRGATLGGSGATPVASALAWELAARGLRVALVGHAHGATPERARVVRPTDDVRVVGDEALACARAFAARARVEGAEGDASPTRAPCPPVVVGPRRADALRFASSFADVLIADTGPLDADVLLLVVSAEAPWGAGVCLPRGDLRAPRDALLASADAVVAVVEQGAVAPSRSALGVPPDKELFAAYCSELFLGEGGVGPPLASLGRQHAVPRVGLVTAMARPLRAVRAIARAGIAPAFALHAGDHAAPSFWQRVSARRAARSGTVDLWLASEKCAQRILRHPRFTNCPTGAPDVDWVAARTRESPAASDGRREPLGAPVFVFSRRLSLGRRCVDWLLTRAGSIRAESGEPPG